MGNAKVLMVAAVLVIAALSAHPAIADISGPAMVTDGDSLKIDGQRIRIHGIDAPEIKQVHGWSIPLADIQIPIQIS